MIRSTRLVLAGQLWTRRYVPVLYWLTIVMLGNGVGDLRPWYGGR